MNDKRQSDNTPPDITQPNEIDKAVGMGLRMARRRSGLSQDELGEMVGVSGAQIQKYEAGANRIGAGRLFNFAQALHVEVSEFFRAINQNAQGNDRQMLIEKELSIISQQYRRITDPKLRKSVRDLLDRLAADTEDRSNDEG